MRYMLFAIALTITQPGSLLASAGLEDLQNYQVNTATMISAAQPTDEHFRVLKAHGLETVVDLIPGDRTAERNLMVKMDLNYYNIAVDWHHPTLGDFQKYVAVMQQAEQEGGITLTHCRLNMRGSAFTYLYRVTQLNEDEASAKKDLLAIWQPDKTWQGFIDTVIAHYQ